MKNLIVLLFILCAGMYCAAQTPLPKTDENINEVVVAPPQFTGVINVAAIDNSPENMLRTFIQDNITYPEKALECFREGTEVVEFVVTPSGELTDFKVINSVCREIDTELIRVLKTTNGMWLPGYNNNTAVAMQKEVSVPFCCSATHSKYSSSDHFYKKAENYFLKASKNMFIKSNLKKALKQYDLAVRYLPYDSGTLLNRGICRYQLGDKEGARSDWKRMMANGCDIDMNEIASLKQFDGYSELAEVLRNK